jgi:hypothetical protein
MDIRFEGFATRQEAHGWGVESHNRSISELPLRGATLEIVYRLGSM